MKKFGKKILAGVLSLAMAMSLCACGGAKKKDEGDKLVKLTIAFSTWVGNGPFILAQEKGFYAKHGLDVEVKIVEDESTYASMLGSQSIDALGHVVDRDVINYSKGIEEKCIMSYDQSTGGDGIIVNEDITSVQDLIGKTVALDKSTTSYFYFLTVIDAAGVSESDITIKDMDADSAGTAFVQGEVDAAVTWEPWLSNASEREGGHLLCSSADYPNTIVDCVFITDAFIEAHPEETKGFVEAWNETIDWYNDGNQDEGNKIMAEGLSIDIADFEAQVPGVTWYDKASMAAFFDEATENNIFEVGDRAVEFWMDRGIIDKSFDIKEFITSDYIEK